MKNQRCCPLAIGVACLAMTLVAQAASFDCTKARTSVEQMICSDQALSIYDERLNFEYKSIWELKRKEFPNESQFATEQKKWLKEVRNSCKDVPCLLNAYAERIEALAEQPEDDDSLIDRPVTVGCNATNNSLFIQAASQSDVSFYKTRGYSVSELEWNDLLITKDGEPPSRNGSKTRAYSCGKLKVEIRHGYLNDDPMGYQGFERFPEIALKAGNRLLIDYTPIGYDAMPSTCPEGAPMRIIVYPSQNSDQQHVYTEQTCLDESENRMRRRVVHQMK